MNARPDHKSIAHQLRCEAIEELLHAFASHDFVVFADAEEYGFAPGVCALCKRPKPDDLHLGSTETVESRVREALGEHLFTTTGIGEREALGFARRRWIERYAETRPAVPEAAR
jgi:hypothetical protein